MLSRRGFLGVSLGLATGAAGSAHAATFKDEWGTFPEIATQPGFVAWKTLRQVKQNPLRGPSFAKDVAALNGQTVKLEGYMVPMDDQPQAREFVLSAFESHCIYCVPGGMPSLAYVTAAAPLPLVAGKTVRLQGTLKLVKDDPSGLLYEVQGATLL